MDIFIVCACSLGLSIGCVYGCMVMYKEIKELIRLYKH